MKINKMHIIMKKNAKSGKQSLWNCKWKWMIVQFRLRMWKYISWALWASSANKIDCTDYPIPWSRHWTQDRFAESHFPSLIQTIKLMMHGEELQTPAQPNCERWTARFFLNTQWMKDTNKNTFTNSKWIYLAVYSQ